MKKNRDMFYSDYQAGAFMNPQMQGQMMPQPSGYMVNNQFHSFGPNSVPEQMNTYDTNEYESRITRLEKSIRKLNQRVTALENNSEDILESDSSNLYII